MRYYFAAAYQRHREMQRNADILTMATGAEVVSSWHREVTPGLDASFDAAYLAAHPAEVWEHGKRDLNDLRTADAIVSFTDGKPARGGRHVEYGWATLAHDAHPWLDGSDQPMRLIVVGPREHVFHCHPDTEIYEYFGAFLQHEITEHLTRTARA
jgi:hypothetical protein